MKQLIKIVEDYKLDILKQLNDNDFLLKKELKCYTFNSERITKIEIVDNMLMQEAFNLLIEDEIIRCYTIKDFQIKYNDYRFKDIKISKSAHLFIDNNFERKQKIKNFL